MKKGSITKIDGVTYTVLSQLGQGGTAEVFRVRSSHDGREYAMKRIPKSPSSQRNERFRNEIEFGLTANHDHVIKIHAHAEDDEAFVYTMDLFPDSLRKVIETEHDYLVLLDYIAQLSDGLAYVHSKGIVHRDLKPENVLVDPQSRLLVLADFGIAHFKDSTITRQGDLLANRTYLAPEQMGRQTVGSVEAPADVFALGLILIEAFTKHNSRGVGHERIGDIHPFLADLDRLADRMMFQDARQRISIDAVCDLLSLARKQVESTLDEISEMLGRASATVARADADAVLVRAAKDVLSSKFIFERADADEILRYNHNYHCEINYRVRTWLYNVCVQSALYNACKSKFEYEGTGEWRDSDIDVIVSPHKAGLLSEFESIQERHPVPRGSLWDGLPQLAAHYFRFCKDYHCEEILGVARRVIGDTGFESVRKDLVEVPIIWLLTHLRRRLRTDRFELSPSSLEEVGLERSVEICWETTDLEDSRLSALGADLFAPPDDSVIDVLRLLEREWRVTWAARVDGQYSIHFRGLDEYVRFGELARSCAEQHSVFEADIDDLLRPAAEYDDLVALVWDPIFQIPVTLAKVLGALKAT